MPRTRELREEEVAPLDMLAVHARHLLASVSHEISESLILFACSLCPLRYKRST